MTTLDDRDTKLAFSPVSPLAEVAETIREDALRSAQRRFLILEIRDLESLLKRPDFFGYFHYELARGVARVLAANDQNVQGVYLYEESTDPSDDIADSTPLDATLHLLVRVTARSAALDSFIASVDRALTDSLRELPSPKFAERSFILDANVVTEEEIEYRTGYGKLFGSLHTPLLQLWQRT